MTRNTLLLGLGNLLCKDDGVGVHAVRRIVEDRIPLPEDVEVVDGGTAGCDLVPLMCSRRKIVIIDAIAASDEPGAIYRLAGEHLRSDPCRRSAHEHGVKQALDMLSILGERPEVAIIGVVPEDIHTLQIGLSDAVEAAMPRVVEEALREVSA